MRQIFIISLLALTLCSCFCKKTQPVATLNFTYPNLTGDKNLNAIRTKKNDVSLIIDTLDLGALNNYNNYSQHLSFEQNYYDYIVFIEGTSYVDTISDIKYEITGRCNSKIKDFQYKHNGVLKTGNQLVIN